MKENQHRNKRKNIKMPHQRNTVKRKAAEHNLKIQIKTILKE